MQHNSTFPIKQNELNMLRDEATSYLKSIQWEQSQRAKNRDNDGKDESIFLRSVQNILTSNKSKAEVAIKNFKTKTNLTILTF